MGEFIAWMIIASAFLAALLIAGGIIHAIRWIARGLVSGNRDRRL